ncbi:MAG: glutathione S-transferase family protein [Alphaproteobacteria bacterium]
MADTVNEFGPLTLTTFGWVPEVARGQVRDLRIRWALEEAGLPYEVRLIDGKFRATPEYLAEQPFGQVPVLREGEVTIFETGAILLHIAERSAALMPADDAARAHIRTWIFAALNSVETRFHVFREINKYPEAAANPAYEGALKSVRQRLQVLEDWLSTRDYLVGGFSAADIMMATVLRIMNDTDIVAGFSVVQAYYEKCLARPAFQKALADHMAVYEEGEA